MATYHDFNFPQTGFQALLFDLDGTLVDSMPAHFEAWCEALELHGAAGIFPEDVFYAMGGRPTKDIVRELNTEHNLQLNPSEVAFAKREAFIAKLHTVEIIEPVVNYAHQWAGKVPMAVVTGGTHKVVAETLQQLNLTSLFDQIITAEDVTSGKPDPDCYLLAAQKLGISPNQCLALEDAAAGIMAAQRAGMRVIAVPELVRIRA